MADLLRRPGPVVPEPEPAPVPRSRRVLTILLATAAGLLLAYVWSAPFVDTAIGGNLARAVLGHEADGAAIAGSLGGLLFAFAAGLGGTFTACNIAAFSAVAPLMRDGDGTGARLRAVLRPLGWVAAGMVPVSAAYGALGVLLGDRLPQLSTATLGNGMPVRLLQAVVVYAVLGVVFTWLGLVALGVVPDPLRRLTERRPNTPQVVMGVLIGLFLVGRPFPLFHDLFGYAAETGNPLWGALAFVLVSLGNVLLLAVMSVLLVLLGGRRLARWLSVPGRAATLTAAALLVAGVFTLVYWGVRLPAKYDAGWFPTAPWNG